MPRDCRQERLSRHHLKTKPHVVPQGVRIDDPRHGLRSETKDADFRPEFGRHATMDAFIQVIEFSDGPRSAVRRSVELLDPRTAESR